MVSCINSWKGCSRKCLFCDGEQKVCGDLTKPPKVCRDTFCEFPTLYVMKMPRQKSVWKTKKCVGDCEKKRGPTKKCVKTEKMRV